MECELVSFSIFVLNRLSLWRLHLQYHISCHARDELNGSLTQQGKNRIKVSNSEVFGAEKNVSERKINKYTKTKSKKHTHIKYKYMMKISCKHIICIITLFCACVEYFGPKLYILT